MADKITKIQKDIKDTLKILIAELEKTKKTKDSNAMEDFISGIYEKAKTFEISIIQKFIFLFAKYYNEISSKCENHNKLVKLSHFMLKNIFEENIILFILKEIKTLFPENRINYIEKEYDEYEMCFILCRLTKNIKIFENYFREYLNIKIFDEIEYKEFDLENPNAINLFEDIFQNIYEATNKFKKRNSDIKSIISKAIKESYKSRNNLFRCKNFYDIMLIRINDKNNFECKCQQCQKEYKEFDVKDILKTFVSEFFCSNCHQKLFLYQENVKCVSCKSLLCMNCKIVHLKNCFSLNYIKMYEVGYKCEIHNEMYVEYCFTCKKNLCEYCKIIHHHHKAKKCENIGEKICKKKYSQLDLAIEKNELIRYNLSQIYLDLKENKLNNGFLYEISCVLFSIKGKDNSNDDIYFDKFNDDEFHNYYYKTFLKITEGNLFNLKQINLIKSYYNKKKQKELKVDLEPINKREKDIREFIDKTKSFLDEIRYNLRFINYDHKINNLKKINSDLLIKIEKINLELFQYKNASRVMKENTYNILSRFLADELLNHFIYKFHNYMNKVNIKLYIFIDLISSGNFEILSNMALINGVKNISKELYEMLNELIKNPKDNDIKVKIIDFICKSKLSKIEFIEDIKLGNDIFKKEDLNKIIELLFLIKNIGNKTAHPNIDLKESLKIINMQELPLEFNLETCCDEIIEKNYKNGIIVINGISKEQNKFSSKSKNIIFEDEDEDGISDKIIKDEDNHLYYHSCDYEFNNIILNDKYDLFNNLKKYVIMTKNEILENMKKFIKNQISRFNNYILKKNGNIKEIIEVIFNENDEKIFNENVDILRTLYCDIDNIIKRSFNMNFEDKFNDEKESIDSFKDLLEIIQMKLNEFEKLKIIRHPNLDEYINLKIKENKENF